MYEKLKEITMTSKITEKYPEIIQQILAYECKVDYEQGDVTNILMEISYCTLTTLSKAITLTNMKWSDEQLLVLLYKLSEAFMKLQKIRIAHRDIKPDNIMINEDMSQIKLIDIGGATESKKDDEI